MFRLYRIPQERERTVIGIDTSEGGDLSAIVAKSKVYCDSFLVFSGHFNSAELSPMIRRAFMFIYRTTGILPWIGVERNMGQATINKLIEWKYPKLYKQEVFDNTLKKYVYKIGWQMTRGNRRKLLDELALDLKNAETMIYDIETIEQLLTFVRNRRSGKPEAESGCFDDLVIAEGIALQLVYRTIPDDSPSGVVRADGPIMEKGKQFKTISKGKEHKQFDLDELKTLKIPRGWKSN